MEQYKILNQNFQIEQVIIFNPNLQPKSSIQKPQEENFQDAKLVYFYPQSEQIESKRNLVGLIEGILLFLRDFHSNRSNDSQNQLLNTKDDIHLMFLDQFIQITGIFQKDFYMDITIRFDFHQQQKNLDQQKQSQNVDYLEFQQNEINDIYEQIDQQNLKRFFKHFVDTFKFVYGNLEDNNLDIYQQEGPILSTLFSTRLTHYISAYGLFYSQKFSKTPFQSKINLQKYSFRGINFAPVDQTLILKINYLVNILKNFDKNISDHLIFYNGYYLNSSIDIENVQKFNDYFYETYSSFQGGNSKLFQRFLLMDQSPELLYEQLCFGILKQRPVEIDLDSCQNNDSQNIFLLDENYNQKFYLKNGDDYKQQHTIFIYVKNLAIILFYNKKDDIDKNNLKQLEKVVIQNQNMITKSLEFQLTNNLNYSDIEIFFYANNSNHSIKASNLIYIKNIDTIIINKIHIIYSQLMKENNCIQKNEIIEKCQNMYLYGFKGNNRIIITILQSNQIDDLDKSKMNLINGIIFKNILI